jgi:serine/threonine protein kinase
MDELPPGPLPIGATVGKRQTFRLDRYLGGGSFGAVYQASPADGTGMVAVKVFYEDLADKVRKESLQREIAALAAVRSRRIPRLLDYALDGPHPHVVMEYFPHGSLSELQARVGPLDEAETFALLESLLEALDAAHGVGVLHLDVKPANILLDGAGGFVIVDFGIAQAPRAGSAMPGLGSLGWQAPEQERRELAAFDLRTDLHGVGMTVWSALTGIDLASREGEMQRKRAERSPITLPPPSFVRKTPFRPELEQIVMSLLQRDPAKRPGNAAAVRAEVRALREGSDAVRPVLPGAEVPESEGERVLAGIVDPLVARALRAEARSLRKLHNGEALCRESERSFHAFVLVKGTVRVVRDNRTINRIDREGEFMGEIAALTGEPRLASLVADGEVYVRVLDAAQLESLVVSNPALAVRLIRAMASRFRTLEPA